MAQEQQLLTSAVNWFGFAELTDDYDVSATTNSSESADTPVTTISHDTPTSTHRIDENEVVVPILSEKSGKTKYKVLARQKAEEDEIAQTTKNTVCDKSMGLKVAEQRKGKSETVHSVKVIESKKTVTQKNNKIVKRLKITPDKPCVKLPTGIKDTPTGKTDLCSAGKIKKTVKKEVTRPVGTGNRDSKSEEVKHLKRRKSDIVKRSKVNQGNQIKKVNDKEAKLKSVSETKNVSDYKEQDQNKEGTMKKVLSDKEVIEIDKAKVDLTERAKQCKAVQEEIIKDGNRTKQIEHVTGTIEELEENRSVSDLVLLGNSENIPNNTESMVSESVNVEEENLRKVEKTIETENETVVTTDLPSIITRAIIEVSPCKPCVPTVSKCSVTLERDPSIDNLHLGTNDISDPHMKSNLYKRKLSDSGNVSENGKQTMSPHDAVSSITDLLYQVSVKRQKSTEEKLKVDMVYDADIDVRKSGRLKSAKCASRYRGDYGIRSDTYSKIASRKTESPVNGEHISNIENGELNRTQLESDDFKGDSVDGLVSMETDLESTGVVAVDKPNTSNPLPTNVIHRKMKQLKNETVSSPEQTDCVEMNELGEQEKSQLVLLNKLDNSMDIDFEMNALDVECVVSEISSENSQSMTDTSSCEPCSTSDGLEQSLNSSIASSEISGILENNSLVPCQTDTDRSGQCNCDKLLELHQTLNSAQMAELVLTSVEMDKCAQICNVSDSDKVNSVDPLTVSSKSGYVHSVGKSVNKKQNYMSKKSSKTTQDTEMCSMVLSPESSPEKCDPVQVLERLRHKMFENVGLSAQVDVKPKSFESKLISSKLKQSKQGSNSMDEPLNSNVNEYNETTQVPSEGNVLLQKTPTRCSTPSSSASSCPSILEEVAKTLNSMSKTKRKNESKDIKPKRKRRRFEEKKFTLRSMSRSDKIAKDSDETHETENVFSVKLDASEYDDHLFPGNHTDAVKLKKSNEIKKKQNRVKSRKKSLKHKTTCDTIHENLNKGGEILDRKSNDATKDNTNETERQQDIKVVKKKPKNVKCHSCCQTFRSKELMRKHYPCRVRQTRTWSQIKLRPTRAFRNDTLQRRRQADFQSKLPKSNKQSNKSRPQLLMQRKTKFRRVKGKRRRKLYQSIQLLINKRKVMAWPHLNVLFPDLSFKEQYLYRLGLFCVGNKSEGLENYSGEDLTLFQKHKDKENENYLARNFKHIFPSSDEESEDATNDAKHSKPEACDITHVPEQVYIQDSNGSQTELQSPLNTSTSTCDSDVTTDSHLNQSKRLNEYGLKSNCDINDSQSRPTALAKTGIQEIEGPLSMLDMNIDKQAIADEIIENVLHSVFENIFENDRKRKVNSAIADSAAKGRTLIDISSTYGILRDTMRSVHEGEIETTCKSDDNNHNIPMEDNSDLPSDKIQDQAFNLIPSEHRSIVGTGLNNIPVPTFEISGTENLVKQFKSDLNTSVSDIVTKEMLSTGEKQIHTPSYSNTNEPKSRLCNYSEPVSFHPKTLKNIAGAACSILGIEGKLEITKPSENDAINSRYGIETKTDEELTTDVALSPEEVCQQKADDDLNSTGMANEVNIFQIDEEGIKSVYAFSTKEKFVVDNDSYYTPETVFSEREITEESCVDKTAAEFESHESNGEIALENKEICIENIQNTLEHEEEQQSIVGDHATGIETSDIRTENIEEENEISVTDFIERFYQKSLEIETAIHACVYEKSEDIDEHLKDEEENIQYELPAVLSGEKAVEEERKMFQEPVTNETKTFIVQQLNEIVNLVESDLESEMRSLYHNNSEGIVNRIPVITAVENNTEPNGSVISQISDSIESEKEMTENETFELDSNTITIHPKPNSLSNFNHDDVESTKNTGKSKDVIELAIDTFINCEKDITDNVSDKEGYPGTYFQGENYDIKSIVDETVYAGTDLSCENYIEESVSDIATNAGTDLQSKNDIKSVSEEADKTSTYLQHEKGSVECISDMAVNAGTELQCENDIERVSDEAVNAGTDLQHGKDYTVESVSNMAVNAGTEFQCENNIERVSNEAINAGTDLQHEKGNAESVSYKAVNSGTDHQCENYVESISDESVNADTDLQCENDIKSISDETVNAVTDLCDNYDLESVSDKAVNAGTDLQCESDIGSVFDELVNAGTDLQYESDIESDSNESVNASTELQCESDIESVLDESVNAVTEFQCENDIERVSNEAINAGTDLQHEKGNVESVSYKAVNSGTDHQCENYVGSISDESVNADTELQCENDNENDSNESDNASTELQCENDNENDSNESDNAVTEIQCENDKESILEEAVNATAENSTVKSVSDKAANSNTDLHCKNDIESNSEEAVIAGTDFQHENVNVESVSDIALNSGTDLQCENYTNENVEVNAGIDLIHENHNVEIVSDTNMSLSSGPLYENFEKEVCVSDITTAPLCDTLSNNQLEENREGNDLEGSEVDDETCDLEIQTCSSPYISENRTKTPAVIKYTINGVFISENLETGIKEIIADESCETDIQFGNTSQESSELSKDEDVLDTSADSDKTADIGKELYDSEKKDNKVEDNKESSKIEELPEKINDDKDILNNKFELDNTAVQKERTNSKNVFIDKTITEKENRQDLTEKENSQDSANLIENKFTCLSTDNANVQIPAKSDSEEIEVMRHSDDVFTTFEKEYSAASLSAAEIIETQGLPVDRNDLTGPFKVLEKDMDISFIIKPETPPILEKVIGDETDDKEQEHFGHENSQLSESDPPVLEPAKKPRSERHFLDVLGEICDNKVEVEKDVRTIKQMPNDIEAETDTKLNSPESLKDFDENISFKEDVGRHFSDVIDCSRPEQPFPEVRLLLHKSEKGEVTLSQIKSLFKPESKKGSPIPKDKLLKIRTGVQSIVSKVKLPQKKDPVWLKRNSLFDYSYGAEEANKYKLANENWSIDDSELSENDPSPQKVSKIDNNNKIQNESDTTAGSITNNILQMLTSLEDKGSFANNMTNLLDILAENLGFQRSSIGTTLEISDENSMEEYTRESTLSCNEINKNMIDGDLDELDEPPPLDEIPIADDFYVFEESSPSRILNRCNITSDKELSLSPTISSLSNISNLVHQREEDDNVGITSQYKNDENNDVNPENINESEDDFDDEKETEDSAVKVSETLNNLETNIESIDCDHCEISGPDIPIQNNVEDVSAFHGNLNRENNSEHVDQSTATLSIPSQNSSKAHTIFKSITELNSIETDEDSDSRETFDVVTISQRISDLKCISKDDLESDEHSDTELEVPTVCDSPSDLAVSTFENDGSQTSSNEIFNGITKIVKSVKPVFDKEGADKETDDIVPTCSSIETVAERNTNFKENLIIEDEHIVIDKIISADDEEEGNSSVFISAPLHNLETSIESANIIHDESMEINLKVDPTVDKDVDEFHNTSCKTKSNQDENIQPGSFQTLNAAIEREDKQYEIDNGDLIDESTYGIKLIDSLEIASTNLIDRNKKEQIDTEHDNEKICLMYDSEIQCADPDQERLIECNNLVPDNQTLGCSEDRGVCVENNLNSCLKEVQEDTVLSPKGAESIATEYYQNAVELKSLPNISVKEENISCMSAEIAYDDESDECEETNNLKIEIDGLRDQRNTQQESKANSDFQSWTAEESTIYSNQNSSDSSSLDTHEKISELVDFDILESKSCLSDVSTALVDESVNINNEINLEANKEREILLNEFQETAENKNIIRKDALTEINRAPVLLEEITVDDLNRAETDDDSSSACSTESIEISNAIDNETRHTLADNAKGMDKLNEINDNEATNEINKAPVLLEKITVDDLNRAETDDDSSSVCSTESIEIPNAIDHETRHTLADNTKGMGKLNEINDNEATNEIDKAPSLLEEITVNNLNRAETDDDSSVCSTESIEIPNAIDKETRHTLTDNTKGIDKLNEINDNEATNEIGKVINDGKIDRADPSVFENNLSEEVSIDTDKNIFEHTNQSQNECDSADHGKDDVTDNIVNNFTEELEQTSSCEHNSPFREKISSADETDLETEKNGIQESQYSSTSVNEDADSNTSQNSKMDAIQIVSYEIEEEDQFESKAEDGVEQVVDQFELETEDGVKKAEDQFESETEDGVGQGNENKTAERPKEATVKQNLTDGGNREISITDVESSQDKEDTAGDSDLQHNMTEHILEEDTNICNEEKEAKSQVIVELNQPENVGSENENTNSNDFVTSEIGNGKDIIDASSQVEVGLNKLEESESENEITDSYDFEVIETTEEEKPSADVSKFSFNSHVHVENMSSMIIRERYCELSSIILEGDDELGESQKLQNADTNAENIETEDNRIVVNSKCVDTDSSHLNAYCDSRKATVCSENAINVDKREMIDITTDGDTLTIENSLGINAVNLNTLLKSVSAVEIINEENVVLVSDEDSNHTVEYGNEQDIETCKAKDNNGSSADQAPTFYQEALDFNQAIGNSSLFQEEFCETIAETVKRKQNERQIKMDQARSKYRSYFPGPQLPKSKHKEFSIFRSTMLEKKAERVRQKSVGSESGENKIPRIRNRSTSVPKDVFIDHSLLSVNLQPVEEIDNRQKIDIRPCIVKLKRLSEKTLERYRKRSNHQANRPPIRFKINLTNFCIKPCSPRPAYLSDAASDNSHAHEESESEMSDESSDGCSGSRSVQSTESEPWMQSAEHRIYEIKHSPRAFYRGLDEEKPIKIRVKSVQPGTNEVNKHTNEKNERSLFGTFDDVILKNVPSSIGNVEQPSVNDRDKEPLNPKWVTELQLSDSDSTESESDQDEEKSINGGSTNQSVTDTVIESNIEETTATECEQEQSEKSHSEVEFEIEKGETCIKTKKTIPTEAICVDFDVTKNPASDNGNEKENAKFMSDSEVKVAQKIKTWEELEKDHEMKILSTDQVDSEKLAKDESEYQICEDDADVFDNVEESLSPIFDEVDGSVEKCNIVENDRDFKDLNVAAIQEEKVITKSQEIVTERPESIDIEMYGNIVTNNRGAKYPVSTEPALKIDVPDHSLDNNVMEENNSEDQRISFDISETEKQEKNKSILEQESSLEIDSTGNVVVQNETTPGLEIYINESHIKYDNNEIILIHKQKARDDKHLEIDQAVVEKEPVIGKNSRNNGEHVDLKHAVLEDNCYKMDPIINSKTREMQNTTTTDINEGFFGQTNTAIDEVLLEEKRKSDNEKKILECSDVSSDMGIEVNEGHDKSASVIEYTTSDQSDDISGNVSDIEKRDETHENIKHNIVESVMDANELDYVIYETNEEGDDQMIRLEHSMRPGECENNNVQMLESKESTNALIGLESEIFTGKTVLEETITDGDEMIYYAVEVNEDFDETNQVISNLERIEEVSLEPEPVNLCDTNEIETNFIESMAVEGYEITENYDSENMVEISEADEIIGHEEIIPVSEVECCSSEMTDLSCVAVTEKRDRFVYGIDEDSQSSQDLVEECVMDCTDEVQSEQSPDV